MDSDEDSIVINDRGAVDGERIGKISKRSDHEVEWTINNFFSYNVMNKDYVSSCFDVTEAGGWWYLEICPLSFEGDDDVGFISLHICRDEDDGIYNSEGLCYMFGVKKRDGTVERFFPSDTWLFDKDSDNRAGYSEFLERSELERRSSELAPSGCLTLIFTWWTLDQLRGFGNLDALSGDLVDLFISKRGSDATLVVKGKEFAVHKSILSARSPVLAAMFEVDMQESRTGIVDIPDCDPEVFREFLMYLYSGKVRGDSKDVFDLYKIAEKYDVSVLRSYCRMSILENLSVENVLDAILLGRQFDEPYIIFKTEDFFNENLPEITASPDWDKFVSENPALAHELLKELLGEEE